MKGASIERMIRDNFGSDPSSTITAMLFAANRKSKYTKEEKENIRKNLEEKNQERKRTNKIISSICPTCDGKLIRGKKDKKNDYKRIWKCKECNQEHLI